MINFKIKNRTRKSRLTWAFTQIKRLRLSVGLTGFEPATP
jgi:hypothetical protein